MRGERHHQRQRARRGGYDTPQAQLTSTYMQHLVPSPFFLVLSLAAACVFSSSRDPHRPPRARTAFGANTDFFKDQAVHRLTQRQRCRGGSAVCPSTRSARSCATLVEMGGQLATVTSAQHAAAEGGKFEAGMRQRWHTPAATGVAFAKRKRPPSHSDGDGTRRLQGFSLLVGWTGRTGLCCN